MNDLPQNVLLDLDTRKRKESNNSDSGKIIKKMYNKIQDENQPLQPSTNNQKVPNSPFTVLQGKLKSTINELKNKDKRAPLKQIKLNSTTIPSSNKNILKESGVKAKNKTKNETKGEINDQKSNYEHKIRLLQNSLEIHHDENRELKERLFLSEEARKNEEIASNHYSFLYKCQIHTTELLEKEIDEKNEELEKAKKMNSEYGLLQKEKDRLIFANELIFQENENLRRDLDDRQLQVVDNEKLNALVEENTLLKKENEEISNKFNTLLSKFNEILNTNKILSTQVSQSSELISMLEQEIEQLNSQNVNKNEEDN
eukprot:TRINITY_DN5597_c0_g1_i1.p1 TRINITY_DN5597_c0_g1~~TRINITY_DN5597_c0_g1_i1.p1  ORF type:complete len:314 (-),score=108.88 TRINITY_DN5597_c0_g1_i1:68-1009(-)